MPILEYSGWSVSIVEGFMMARFFSFCLLPRPLLTPFRCGRWLGEIGGTSIARPPSAP
jgi:hypothetical protein